MVLLFRMTNIYFSTGRYVIIDSGFCVLKGLIQLSKKGIFACAVIKKRKYWTSMVPVKDMKDHFGEVEVGDTDSMKVTVDYVIYNVWGMKEPTYVMGMIVTGVCLWVDDTRKDTLRICKENGENAVKKFKYKLPFDWKFCHRHAFDDHNNFRHSLS